MPNILLIDDSGVIRSSLKSILERNGFAAFEATSLNDLKYNSFSKTVKLSEINLILLDYYLESGNNNPLRDWTPEVTKQIIDFIESKIKDSYKDLSEYEKTIAIKNDVIEDVKKYLEEKIANF